MNLNKDRKNISSCMKVLGGGRDGGGHVQGSDLASLEPRRENSPSVFWGSRFEMMCRTKKNLNFDQNYEQHNSVNISCIYTEDKIFI